MDRLATELRPADIKTLADANRFLAPFLARSNQRFGVLARETGQAHRALDADCDVEQICCFVYYRTAGTDNTVRLGAHRFQLQPGPGRMSYAKTRVEMLFSDYGRRPRSWALCSPVRWHGEVINR